MERRLVSEIRGFRLGVWYLATVSSVADGLLDTVAVHVSPSVLELQFVV